MKVRQISRAYADSRCLVCGRPCKVSQVASISLVVYVVGRTNVSAAPRIAMNVLTRCHAKCCRDLYTQAVTHPGVRRTGRAKR